MSIATPRTFHVIDSMPGSGKTQFFVTKAASQLNTGRAKLLLIYVAPTVQLMAEAYCRVVALIKDPSLLKKIHIVCDHVSANSKFTSFCQKKNIAPPTSSLPADPPTVALNFLLGLMRESEYQQLSYPRSSSYAKSMTNQAVLGDVIITTHESFVRVASTDSTSNDFQLLRNSVVIFDEARQCVLNTQTVVLEPEERALLFNCFRMSRPLPTTTASYKIRTLESVDSDYDIMGAFKVNKMSAVPSKVRALAKQFREFSKFGRAAMYIVSGDTTDGGLGKPLDSHTIYTMLRPTSLFDHYKKVYLTSAFFSDSQMFSFLKADGHSFIQVLDGPLEDPALISIRTRDTQLRANLAKRLDCAVLLNNPVGGTSRDDYRYTLTIGLLNNGMIIPTKLQAVLKGNVDPSYGVHQLISSVAKDISVTKNPAIDKTLRAYAQPPLWILMRAATRIYLDWAANNPHANRTLLTINTDRSNAALWQPKRMGYNRVARCMLEKGYVALVGNNGIHDENEFTSEQMEYFAKALSPYWEKYFKKYVYHKSDDHVFAIPRSPKLHGLNTYSGIHAFCHLAALNPDPQRIFVYKSLMPEYDIDQDHSIENLVQMLYRTSLRQPEATERVLMIVPYLTSVDLLSSKIYKNPKRLRVMHLPKLSPLIYRRSIDAEKLQQSARKGNAASLATNRKYAVEDTKEVRSLGVKISQCRKALREASVPLPKVEARLEAHQARLAALRKIYQTGGL